MKRPWLIALVCLHGCNVETVEPESLATEPPRYRLDELPQVPSQNDETDPTTVWAASVRRSLGFLTAPGLGGRRPGTDGAELTTSAITSLFTDAGLIPSAPTLGWTTPVGIRAVQVVDPRMLVTIPLKDAIEGQEPERIELTEGLWLRHRGAAGTFHLPMEVVALAPQVDIADRLAVGVVPLLGEEIVDPITRVRGLFDAVTHRRPGGCVLQLPPERTPLLRQAAMTWADVEIQPRALSSDPPAGLPVEGFVSPAGFAALRKATATPGSQVDVYFNAEERWFEDSTVLGRIAGREKPEQLVLVTTSWDAGGLAPEKPQGGEAQAASGLAVMLAVVERMSLVRETGRTPSRSIVFVAAAGGSLGNLGLEQLAGEGLALPENIVAVVNLDRLDWTAQNLTVIGGHRSTIGERVREFIPAAVLTDHEPGYGHLAFDLPRVPRVTLTRRGGSAPDTLDPSVPLTNLANTAKVTFDLVWDLADEADTPVVILPRVDDPEQTDEPGDPEDAEDDDDDASEDR